MKKALIFLTVLISLFLFSCSGEDETCEEIGCNDGQHCIIEKDLCVNDCTDDYCAVIGAICNPDTKECEDSCLETGCPSGEVCNEKDNECVASCLDVQCSEGTHCNVDSKLCDDNCTDDTCTETSEVCDPESFTCVVKAETPCDDTSCQDGSHCNTTTGYCVGGCADIECSTGKVCNPNLLRCVNECTIGVCRGESFCNLDSKLCEAYSDYVEGPYGTEYGDTVENLSWVDVDNQNVSLKKYHSMFVKTGYPRVMILVISAGWCSPCRQEAPLMGDFYNEMRLPSGKERVAVIQTIVDDNIADGVLSNPDGFAKSWRDEYNLKFPVVGDPADSVTHLSTLDPYNAAESIPFNMIVNVETMKIEDLQNGTDEVLGSVKTKVKEVEKRVVCEPLDCDEDNGHYCIFNSEDGSAECS